MMGARDVTLPARSPSASGSSCWAACSWEAVPLRRSATDHQLVRLRQPDVENQLWPGLNVDFWLMGLQILGVAWLAAAVVPSPVPGACGHPA